MTPAGVPISMKPVSESWWEDLHAVVLVALSSLAKGEPIRLDHLTVPAHGSSKDVEAAYRRFKEDGVLDGVGPFLDVLVAKGAMDSRTVGQWSPFYKVKNRFFVSSLMEKLKTQGPSAVAEFMGAVLPAPLEPELEPEPDLAVGPGTGEDELDVAPEVPVRPRRVDSAAVYDLLSFMVERFAKSVDLQVQMAETLVFVKDEVVAIRERQSSLSKRLKSMESATADPAPPSIVDSSGIREEVASLSSRLESAVSSVNSIRQEVVGAVKSAAERMESDRMSRIAEAAGRLSGEICVLRDALSEESEDE